jgi:tetratricopeptide (TPR) repeat protein
MMGQAWCSACPLFFMPRRILLTGCVCLVASLALSFAGTPQDSKSHNAEPQGKTLTGAAPSAGQDANMRAIAAAESGHCQTALPTLKKVTPQIADKQVKRRAGIAGLRCALGMDQRDAAASFVALLNREFPQDPEILYLSVHAYSDLSTRMAQDLGRTAPNSSQAHELNAEAMEIQGKWDEAEKEYQAVLAKNPDQQGIHFRLGRLLLSKPNPAPDAQEKAAQEFRKELEIDPRNAGAEYILGEIARQQSRWPEAIEHFTKATQLDASLNDAFLGLGMAQVAAGDPAKAIPALETYAKRQPGNPAGHYELAIAYSRVGRKDDARREATLQKEAAERIEQAKQRPADAPAPQ